MPVLSDQWIIENSTNPSQTTFNNEKVAGVIYPQYKDNFVPVIENFEPKQVRYVSKVTGKPVDIHNTEDQYRKIISYGTSSYGYDVRLQADPTQIKVFSNVHCHEINPKNIRDENFATPEIRVDEEGAKYVLIPPHSYIQAPTIEYFNIPRDVLVIVVGKSTYARAALIANVTPVEPGFVGEVVIEVGNLCSSPVRCYLEEGIAQFVFLKGEQACKVSYGDRGGKYMGQTGLTYAKV